MKITKDCIVTVDYHINDTEGKLLHEEEEPIIYLHGNYGHIFPTIEEILEGKSIGDTFTIALNAKDAFGEYDPELVLTEKVSELPEGLTVGMEIEGYMDGDEDDVIIYTVSAIEGKKATLDGNHPLAGMDLVFEGTILDIHRATDQEIQEILTYHQEH
jgi:FKBP-type peptidyl-prolyl cis-trans isomerase SlyD